ncbi:MAG: hypothetical protein HY271_05740 [Deltaproteobacteria bacterium]|nr:hypothetical protein [Deltaproteobacteria bacterium]
MRKMMALVAVIASCVLGARVASAGHFEHWTDAERAEHEQPTAEVAPCPPPVAESCPAAVAPDTVSHAIYWSTGADTYDDSQSHPLRLLAYIIHPVGYTLEWLVTRPFHEVVAQPDLEPIFGHDGHAYYGESPFGVSGARGGRSESVYR